MVRNIWKKIGMLMLIFSLIMGVFPADLGTVTVSAASETKASDKKGWVQKGAKWYYYNAKGKMVKNTWQTISKKKYYFGADGARKQNGWYTAKAEGTNNYISYYFDKNGVFVRKAGTYKDIDDGLVNNMDSILKDQKITAGTKANAAIKKLYTLIRDKYSYDSLSARGFHPENAKKDWEYGFAKEMLAVKKGSCYHYASALAFLIKRATSLPVRIATGSAEVYKKGNTISHGWVEVKINGKWYTYDPLVDRNKTNRQDLKFALYKLAPATAKKYYKATKYFVVNI